MPLGDQLILIGAGLVCLSIFAGLISSRVGAPLLLVFLGLGMLAGEDGPGGLDFDNFESAYVIGATALAIILFDGGLRTKRPSLKAASWPALTLATIGVVLTAVLTGLAAMLFFGLSPLEGLLVGSIVASTDAAAVFFLLHLRGTNLKKRVSSTLEVESGLNDPMAVFLTVTCIELLSIGLPAVSGWAAAGELATRFAIQMLGGAALGLLGGFGLLFLINRLQLAPGLYPILAVAGALTVFAGSQTLGASGFLAIFLTGVVLGNYRHRATQLIDRFQDGLAWLSQIVMFLMLGLLVTPSELLDNLWAALGVALFLILIGRPLSVILCLLPFKFTWPERFFMSWVGLRGAVPIFLGSLPVVAELPNARLIFDVAFVVVITSLLIQGWTITLAARALNLALPPEPEPSHRFDVDLPTAGDRDFSAYTVRPGSPAVGRRPSALPWPEDAQVLSIMRDGRMKPLTQLRTVEENDTVLVVAPPETLPLLDRMFATPPKADRKGRSEAALGEFAFDGQAKLSQIAAFYDVPLAEGVGSMSLNAFLRSHLPDKKNTVVGDRLRLGNVELIVRQMEGDRITKVGIELDPQDYSLRRLDPLRIWLSARLAKLRRRRTERLARRDENGADNSGGAAGDRRFGLWSRGLAQRLRGTAARHAPPTPRRTAPETQSETTTQGDTSSEPRP